MSAIGYKEKEHIILSNKNSEKDFMTEPKGDSVGLLSSLLNFFNLNPSQSDVISGISKKDEKITEKVIQKNNPNLKLDKTPTEEELHNFIHKTKPFRTCWNDKRQRSKYDDLYGSSKRGQATDFEKKLSTSLSTASCKSLDTKAEQCRADVKDVFQPYINELSTTDEDRMRAATIVGSFEYNTKRNIEVSLNDLDRDVNRLSKECERGLTGLKSSNFSEEAKACGKMYNSINTYKELFEGKSEAQIRNSLEKYLPDLIPAEYHGTNFQKNFINYIFKVVPIKSSQNDTLVVTKEIIRSLGKLVKNPPPSLSSADKQGILEAYTYAQNQYRIMAAENRSLYDINASDELITLPTRNFFRESGFSENSESEFNMGTGDPTTTDYGHTPRPSEQGVNREDPGYLFRFANSIYSVFRSLWQNIGPYGSNLWQKITYSWSTGWNNLYAIFEYDYRNAGWSSVCSWVTNILSNIYELWNGLKGYFVEVKLTENPIKDPCINCISPKFANDDLYNDLKKYAYNHIIDESYAWKNTLSQRLEKGIFTHNRPITSEIDKVITDEQLKNLDDTMEKRRFRKEMAFNISTGLATCLGTDSEGFANSLLNIVIRFSIESSICPTIDKWTIYAEDEQTNFLYKFLGHGASKVPMMVHGFRLLQLYKAYSGADGFLTFLMANTTSIIFYLCKFLNWGIDAFSWISGPSEPSADKGYCASVTNSFKNFLGYTSRTTPRMLKNDVNVFTDKIPKSEIPNQNLKDAEEFDLYYYNLKHLITNFNKYTEAIDKGNDSSSKDKKPSTKTQDNNNNNSSGKKKNLYLFNGSLDKKTFTYLHQYIILKLKRIGKIGTTNVSPDLFREGINRTSGEKWKDWANGSLQAISDTSMGVNGLYLLSDMIKQTTMAAGQLSSFFFSAATLQLGSILKPAVDIFGTMTAFAWWGFTFLASVVIIVALVLFLMPQPHITPKLVSCLSQTLFVVGFTGFPLVFIGITAGAVYRYKQGDKISSKIGSKYHNISHNEKKKLYNKMKNGEVHENEDNEQNVNSAEFIHFINTFSDYIFTSAPDLLDKPYGFEHYISKIFPN
jgi:hypothetical protein